MDCGHEVGTPERIDRDGVVRHERNWPKTKKAGKRERPRALFLTGLRCDGPPGCAGLPIDSSSAKCIFVGRKTSFLMTLFPSDVCIVRDKLAKASKPCGNPFGSSTTATQTPDTPWSHPLLRVGFPLEGLAYDPAERSKLRCAVRWRGSSRTTLAGALATSRPASSKTRSSCTCGACSQSPSSG